MRHFSAVLVALVLSGVALSAQVAADPHDFFYDDLTVWETMGLVKDLPAARPYPLPLVKRILAEVAARGDSSQRKIAERHSRRLFGRILHYGGKGTLAIDTANSYKQMDVAISFDVNYIFNQYVSVSASVDGWATNKLPSEELIPQSERSTKDIVKDNAKAGPFWILPSLNSSLSVGTADTYFNAGMMRGSWGPIHDNGVLFGSQTLHSGQWNATVNREKWAFNFSLYALSATTDEDLAIYYPEKYLAIHSVTIRPRSWLEISAFESVMYGGRFETLYLLPASAFMISQGNTGFADNNYIGGMFTVRPTEGFKIDGMLIADDMSFNDIVKFQWDTKWRIAGQLAVSYAPRKSGFFTLASLDYTMVTPYTYSHKVGHDLSLTDPNYQSFTHAGNCVGAALEPNSDRLNLKVKLRPLDAMDIDIVGTLIRHGNVNESLDIDGEDYMRVWQYLTDEDLYVTDGSVNNSSATHSGHAFFFSTPFLTQETIQYVWQAGFDVTARLPKLKTGGLIVFKLGYRFEVDINPNVGSEMYVYDNALDGLDPTDTGDRAIIEAAAQSQRNAWRDAVGGTVFNNYISAGMEYYY